MANYSKPLNQYDFKNGERPANQREEEKFMYKYLETKEMRKPEEVDEDLSL